METNIKQIVPFGAEYHFEHWRGDALVGAWTEHNIVPTEGADYALNVHFGATAKASGWYIGLFSNNATLANAMTYTDITENDGYDEATRQACTFGTGASRAISNSAAVAQFTMTGAGGKTTVYGGFLTNVATKNSSSTLMSVIKLGSPRTVADGDVIKVTVTISVP